MYCVVFSYYLCFCDVTCACRLLYCLCTWCEILGCIYGAKGWFCFCCCPSLIDFRSGMRSWYINPSDTLCWFFIGRTGMILVWCWVKEHTNKANILVCWGWYISCAAPAMPGKSKGGLGGSGLQILTWLSQYTSWMRRLGWWIGTVSLDEVQGPTGFG